MQASELIDRVLDEAGLDEFTEKRMSAKAKTAQRKFRKSAAGKKSARRFAKKSKKAGYRPDPSRSRSARRGSRSR